jgi:hypothetical protein
LACSSVPPLDRCYQRNWRKHKKTIASNTLLIDPIPNNKKTSGSLTRRNVLSCRIIHLEFVSIFKRLTNSGVAWTGWRAPQQLDNLTDFFRLGKHKTKQSFWWEQSYEKK